MYFVYAVCSLQVIRESLLIVVTQRPKPGDQPLSRALPAVISEQKESHPGTDAWCSLTGWPRAAVVYDLKTKSWKYLVLALMTTSYVTFQGC